MKLFAYKTRINQLLTIAAAWGLVGLTCQSAFAQNSYETEEQQIFRDNSVVPTDFQKEVPTTDSALKAMEKIRFEDQGKSNAPINGFMGALKDLTPTENSTDDELESSSTDNLTGSVTSFMGNLKNQTAGIDIPKVVGSLAIVLGGYLGFVWLTRRLGVSGNQGLPAEVVEVLGQTAFGPRKHLQLVRLGSKLLLLLNSQDGSTQTIGEITDPHEVDYLSSICGNRNSSRSAIAISKATSSQEKSDLTGSELKRVLRQLQQSGERNRAGTVFDA